ncbi:MAG: two-component system response regulator [SAR324 cluster bacterium]|uniref:Two-component system response regulator n=1 Tax=SAR324 cluster bacterium TaxID=2024889 RepID=A0A2A4STJ4_9DELT|nr:MAG: two-component system response regulator [SAR324 cluster bacterium]
MNGQTSQAHENLKIQQSENLSFITDEALYQASILVVDDEEINLAILSEILESEGYQNIILTQDPIEALRLYQKNNCDLILLDILMPGMSGFEVMDQIGYSDQHPKVPILVLTALNDEKTRLQALTKGARDFLVKPFNNEEVLVRIKNLLEVRLIHKQLHQYNEKLEQRVQERTLVIESTQLEIIHRLGLAAEYRDNETGAHIIRMSQYAKEVGKVIGLNNQTIELILQASPMHDIGKIGIPDKILLKPGPLTPEEFECMKTHTTIGAEILSGHDSELLQIASCIALTHHEKWDGSGYPNGLKGNAIPLTGRITAVADVFDALSSKRPYKIAWPIDKSVEYMQEFAGKHFDPDLVKAFLTCLPTILKIQQENKS